MGRYLVLAMKDLKNKIEELIDANEYEKACTLLQEKLKFTWKIKGVKFDSMNWDSTNQKRNIFKIELEKDNNTYTFDFGSSVYNSCKPSNEFDMLDENSSIELYSRFGYRFKDKLELTASINFNMTKKEMLELNEDVINKVVKEYSEIFDKNAVEYNINRKYKPTEINYKHSSKENLKERISKTISEKIKGLKSISSYLNNEQKEIIEEPRLYDIIACLTKYDPGTFEDFCSEFGYDDDSGSAEKIYNAVKDEYLSMCTLFSDEELEILSLIN